MSPCRPFEEAVCTPGWNRVRRWAEKRREDRLRAEGLSVVRWTWADLRDFAPVADRLREHGVR
jgi:hypothetical protein